MLNGLKKLGLGAALAASALLAASPASARDHYRDRGGNDAAIAIGAGIIGLAIGAAIADYVTVRGYPGYYYYYDGYPNRYYRDRYYSRYYAPYYRERWSRGYDRHFYSRRDWHHDRRDWRRDRRHDRREHRRDHRRYDRYRR